MDAQCEVKFNVHFLRNDGLLKMRKKEVRDRKTKTSGSTSAAFNLLSSVSGQCKANILYVMETMASRWTGGGARTLPARLRLARGLLGNWSFIGMATLTHLHFVYSNRAEWLQWDCVALKA